MRSSLDNDATSAISSRKRRRRTWHQTSKAAAVVACLAGAASNPVHASPCAAFDTTGTTAYVFGTPYGDLSLGSNLSDPQPSSVVDLSNKTGRPDFTGSNTQCFVNQFTNGLYVLGASTNSSIEAYIFDFASQTWSTQAISSQLDPNAYTAILDHDTNVLYAYRSSDGTISSLAFDQSKAASTGDTLDWVSLDGANSVPFETNVTYQPVMGAANNHIQFLNTPSAAEGDAYIFVIHFAQWQEKVQNFGAFPSAFGQTVTILSNSSAAPSSFAFIPDGGNSTYVINAKTNTTTTYPGPSIQDSTARYGASTNGLIQVTPNGTVAHYTFGSSETSWTMLDLASLKLPASNTSSSTNETTTSASAGVGGAAKAATPSSLPTGAASSGMRPIEIKLVLSLSLLVVAIASLQLL